MARLPRALFCDRVAHCFIHAVDGVWFAQRDIDILLATLRRLVPKHHIQILYFTILSNHVHAILKFSEDVSCGKLMGILNGNMAKAFNQANRRKGHVWRERFKDVTVQEVSHFWSALLYVAMNKRKAGMIDEFEKDLSSSFGVYALGHLDNITTPSEEYLELGATPEERQAEFKSMLNETWDRLLDAQSWDHTHDDEEILVAKGRVDLKRLLAISDHVEELLLKGEPVDKAASEREVDPFSLSEESVAAMDRVRTRTTNARQNLLADLMAMGASSRILNLFWADHSFILDFVQAHRTWFGLPVEPPG